MTGAVGAANAYGTPDETERSVLQLPSLQYGTNTLNNVLIASFPPNMLKKLKDRAGVDTIGLLGGIAFRNYRVGIDYTHSTVYLDRITATASPETDVVGLTLRPEPGGRYTVLAVVDFNGERSVPEVKAGDLLVGVDGAPVAGATMGQVWSLLGGSPGQTRSLTVERDGKRFKVDAALHRFLAAQSKVHPFAKTGQKESNKK